MTGVIATIPKLAFSANGAPMANGTVTTYLAGTTTLATTWQDRAQTSANTNPIVLDSRGEATIWLDGSKTYKFVLKDSLGATQWTTDNISGVTSFAQGNPVTVAYAATVTVDASLSNIFYIGTLTGPTTLAITNPTDGQTINIRFLQDGTGGRTVTLPGTVSVNGALITTAGYVDWLILTYVASSSRWEGCWANATTSPTAFGSSLLTAADAAAGRTVMGASTVGNTVFTAASAAAARTPLSLAGDWFKGLISAARTTTGTFGTYTSTQGAGLNGSTGVYTVPTTGKYLFYAYYQLTPGATAGQFVDYGFVSTGTVSSGGFARIVVPSASVSGVNMYMGVMWFIDLNAGDTVVAQSGVNASALTCSCQEFSGVRIN